MRTDAEDRGEEREVVAEAYDEIAPHYDDSYQDPLCAAEDRLIARLLRRAAAGADRILDVGCGTGWVLDHLNGQHYRGFDISPGMIEVALAKHPHAKLTVADMNEPWPYPDGWADLVVSTYASPSYAADVHLFAKRVHAALAPGGTMLLMPHAGGQARSRHYLPAQTYNGCRPWKAKRAVAALRDAGLTDLNVRGLRHPTVAPPIRTPARLHDLWLDVEQRLWKPDQLRFLIVTGRKPWSA